MRVQPLVLTRPTAKLLDYQWFACPNLLMNVRRQLDDKNGLIRRKVDSVLNADISCGTLPIDGRWHVWRIEGVTIVAQATERFEHRDGFGREIRGYYGFATEDDFVGTPSDKCVDFLEKKFVAPLIDSMRAFDPLWSDYIQIDDALFDPFCISEDVEFNYDNRHIKYFASYKWGRKCLLDAAIKSANNNKPIEFIYGINFRDHAEKSAFLNVVCQEQKEDRLASIESNHAMEKEPIFTREKHELNRQEHYETNGYKFGRDRMYDTPTRITGKRKYRLVLECSRDWQQRIMKLCVKVASFLGLLDDCKEMSVSENNYSDSLDDIGSPSPIKASRIRRDNDTNIGF